MSQPAKTKLDFSAWTCPAPLTNYPNIIMGHGSGGRLSNDLIKHLILPIFNSPKLEELGDAALLPSSPESKIAFSTDSFVVHPIFFPDSNIGELAIHGTVNDLAMSGAKPAYISAALILEEGLPIVHLAEVLTSMAAACLQAGVQLVAGDTKVVGKGQADGLFINTTGIGFLPADRDLSPRQIRPGDAVIVNGTLGDHGMAVMSLREGLEFESQIVSDTAPLNGLVAAMLEICPNIHALRDATRGGLAAVLNELAQASKLGIEVEESALPVSAPVQAACEILGFDPLYVANEGKLVAFVPADYAQLVLETMRSHPLGREAQIIGKVLADHPGRVIGKTLIGASRLIDLPAGEILPRIC